MELVVEQPARLAGTPYTRQSLDLCSSDATGHSQGYTPDMRLRRLLRQLLVLVLAISVVPGLGELAEVAEHLVHDGHLPHSSEHDDSAVADDHHDVDTTEHGCTPISHRCVCHASSPAILVSHALPEKLDEVSIVAFHPWEVERLTSRANAPPTRPPIS